MPRRRSEKHKPAYLALVGDLVASRDNLQRPKVQRALRAALEEVNDALRGPALAAEFRLTAGDEIQALLRRPSVAPRAIQILTDRLFGAPLSQPIAFGIGWGELSTGELDSALRRSTNVALLDGPCFHRARASLERCKDKRGWAAFEGFGEERDVVLDSLFDLMNAIRGEWTSKQNHYAVATREHGQQRSVARRWHVSPSVVSESLKAARFETILDAERTVEFVLRCFEDSRVEGGKRA